MVYLARNPALLTCLKLTDWLIPQVPKREREINSILLVNLSHLGDVINATSVIEPIKKAYPNAKLGLLVGSGGAPLLVNHPQLDAIHTFDHPLIVREKRRPSSPLPHYDVAIDLSPYFPNSIPLLAYKRIPIRIGFTSGGFGKLLTHPVSWCEEKTSMAMHYKKLLKELNIPSYKPKLSLGERKKRGDYFVIQLSGGAPHKEWPLENWKKLLAALDAPFFFVGKGEKERALASKLAPEEHNQCDCLTLPELIDFIGSAKGFIGVDSVGGHIAAAFDVPSAILFHKKDDRTLWRPLSDHCTTFSLHEDFEPIVGWLENRISRYDHCR